MTEDQFLERYTTESLKVMARRRGMPQATNASKAALISFLTPRLFSHEANQRLVQALPQRQRRILSVLKTRGNEADTVALAASVEGDTREIASDIRRLVELGLLLYPREEHSRLYRLGECGRVWMDRTAAEAVEPLAVSGPSPKLLADPPAQVREANLGLMLADLFVFLQHLERHPYQPGKSAAEDVNEWSDLAAAMLVPTPVPPGPGLAGGDRLLFLYGLLEEADLLKVKGGRLRPAESAARFFHLEPADQARQVLSAWLHLAEWNEFDRITELIPRSAPDRRQESDRPGSGRVMQARKRVLATLKRFEPGRWYAFSALLREIKKTHPGFLIPRRSAATSGGQYLGFGERGRGDTSRALDLTTDWDRVEGRFVARVLMESLHWLGAVSLGFDDTAEDHGSHLDAFRLTNAGALLLGLSRLLPHPPDDGGLLVQPDFTMMVLSSFPDTGLLHDLSRFSEYTGGDRVIRFTLNRPAAQRGFRNGWTTVKILERLESAAGQPVLGSLASRLEDWERSFNRFRIVRQVTLLEDTDGLLAQALAGSDLAGGLGEPLAPGLFRPDATALPRLFRRLKKEKVPVLRFDHAQVGHGLRLGPGLKIRQHPRGADWITTALLERVAIRQEDDQAVWKLDKKKVQAALKEGLPARHLREQMEERSQEISPEIRLALRTWSSEGRPVSLARACLFTCEDRHLLRLILDTPSLAAHLGERLAPDTFTLKGGLTPFRRALHSLGVRVSAKPGQRHRAPLHLDDTEKAASNDGTLPFHWERRDGVRGMAATARSEEQLHFLLNRAIEKRRKLCLDYFDAGMRQTVTREVSPLLLEDLSLAAFSHQSRTEESYLLARILAVRFLPERY